MAASTAATMSVRQLIEQTKREAVEKAGLPPLPKKEATHYPLVPIFIGLDHHGSSLREVCGCCCCC